MNRHSKLRTCEFNSYIFTYIHTYIEQYSVAWQNLAKRKVLCSAHALQWLLQCNHLQSEHHAWQYIWPCFCPSLLLQCTSHFPGAQPEALPECQWQAVLTYIHLYIHLTQHINCTWWSIHTCKQYPIPDSVCIVTYGKYVLQGRMQSSGYYCMCCMPSRNVSKQRKYCLYIIL